MIYNAKKQFWHPATRTFQTEPIEIDLPEVRQDVHGEEVMYGLFELCAHLDDAYMQCGTDPFDDIYRGYEDDGDGSWKERMAVANTDSFLRDLNREAKENKPKTWRQRNRKIKVPVVDHLKIRIESKYK